MITCHIENCIERATDKYNYLLANKPTDMSDKLHIRTLREKNRLIVNLQKALNQDNPHEVIQKLTQL